MDSTTTAGQSWGDWFQGVGATVIKGYADYKVYNPFQTQQLEIQKLGQAGYYTEGQKGQLVPPGTVGGIPTSLLLIGGLVVVVLLLKA